MLVGEDYGARHRDIGGRLLHARSVLGSAASIVNAVALAPHGIGITEIAKQVGLPKSTAYRLARQLTESGVLEKNDDKYCVGAAVARWGRARQSRRALRSAADAPLRRLAHLTGASTSVVSMLDGRPDLVLTESVLPLPLSLDLSSALWQRTASARLLNSAWTFADAGPDTFAVDEGGRSAPFSSLAGALLLPGLPERTVVSLWYLRPELPANAPEHLYTALRAISCNWEHSELRAQHC